MILEMHAHTIEHSHCSHVAAADLVQSNFDKGLQGTVLTDHHYLWSPEEIRELRSRLKVPDYYLILAARRWRRRSSATCWYTARMLDRAGTGCTTITEAFPGCRPGLGPSLPEREHPLPRKAAPPA